MSKFTIIENPKGHKVVVGACKRDVEDVNDKPYERQLQVKASDLPGFVDLRAHMTTVEDQGKIGSCTANAIAGAYEYLEKRLIGKEGDVSRLFIYYMERKLEGHEDEDAGASLRDGMKVLNKFGVCSEPTWPYDIRTFRTPPDEKAMAEALTHTIDEYRRLPVNLHAMKTCLAEGYPFVFGVKLYSSFREVDEHGKVRVPSKEEELLGGHALVACGYSDHDQVFVVRNSWGTEWGENGYCYFPFDYLSDVDAVHDCWTLRKAHNLDFSVKEVFGPRGEKQSFFSQKAK